MIAEAVSSCQYCMFRNFYIRCCRCPVNQWVCFRSPSFSHSPPDTRKLISLIMKHQSKCSLQLFHLLPSSVCDSILTSTLFVWVPVPDYYSFFVFIHAFDNDVRKCFERCSDFVNWFSVDWEVNRSNVRVPHTYSLNPSLLYKIRPVLNFLECYTSPN